MSLRHDCGLACAMMMIALLHSATSHELPVANNWFVTEQLRSPSDHYALFRTREIHEKMVNDGIAANYYLLRGKSADVLIDAGFNFKNLSSYLLSQGLIDEAKPLFAIGTHEHFDHATGLKSFEGLKNARIMLGAADAQAVRSGDMERTCSNEVREYAQDPQKYWDAAPFASQLFRDALLKFEVKCRVDQRLSAGDIIELGADAKLDVLELPGHTPGSIGFYDAQAQVVFTGDAVYSGELYDQCPDSNKIVYRKTMQALRDLPVKTAFPGHFGILNRTGYLEVIDCYLAGNTICRASMFSHEELLV